MQGTRILLTLLSSALLTTQLAGMPGKQGKAMCGATCHNSDKGPNHPSVASQDQTSLLRALQEFKQDAARSVPTIS